jgi:hypothetical protein
MLKMLLDESLLSGLYRYWRTLNETGSFSGIQNACIILPMKALSFRLQKEA